MTENLPYISSFIVQFALKSTKVDFLPSRRLKSIWRLVWGSVCGLTWVWQPRPVCGLY